MVSRSKWLFPRICALTCILIGFSRPSVCPAQPQPQIEGTLSNFDVWNRTGFIADDFEVALEGILGANITDLYNGAFNPFADGVVTTEGNFGVIRWSPLPGVQVNPDQKAHFGFKIRGNLTPVSQIFRWTQQHEPLNPRVPVDGQKWRALTGQQRATEAQTRGTIVVENSIPNLSLESRWIQRRTNTTSGPVILDDLLAGSPLDLGATTLDPMPVPLPPGAEILHLFSIPPGSYAVMIVDFYDDVGGAPGTIQGTWFDAVEANFAPSVPSVSMWGMVIVVVAMIAAGGASFRRLARREV